MGRRSDHNAEELKQLILDAAEELIISQGVANLSARRLATQIGYTVGTLYNQFKNLDEIILHVNARTLDDLYAYLSEGKDQSIRALAQRYFQYSQENTNRWLVVFEFQMGEAEKLPDWYQAKIIRLFEFLNRALALESPNREASIAEAETLWAGVHGICTLAHKGKLGLVESTPSDELVALLLETFLAGLDRK